MGQISERKSAMAEDLDELAQFLDKKQRMDLKVCYWSCWFYCTERLADCNGNYPIMNWVNLFCFSLYHYVQFFTL